MSDKMAKDGDCRLCSTGKSVILIDDSIRDKIVECYKITVRRNDGLPQKICLRCKVSVCTFHTSMRACHDRQAELLKKRNNESRPIFPIEEIQIKQELNVESEPPAKKFCKTIEERNIESHRDILKVQSHEKQLINVVNPAAKPASPKPIADHHSDTSEDKVKKTIPSYLVRYNCTFCLKSYPNKLSLMKHMDMSHNQLVKYCDSLVKPCFVRLKNIDQSKQRLEPWTNDWVHINSGSVRSIDPKTNHCFLSRTSYIRRYPQAFGTVENEQPEDSISLTSTSSTNDDSVVANDPESHIDTNSLHFEEIFEDDYDKNENLANWKPETIQTIIKESYNEFKSYKNHFKRKFVNKLKNGILKVMWVNSRKSINEPYFLKSSVLQKQIWKQNGICSNMFGLKPYRLQVSSAPSPPPPPKANEIYFLSKLEMPQTVTSASVAPTTTVINQDYQGLPKIICAFSIPQDGNAQKDNIITNGNNSSPNLQANRIAAAQTPPVSEVVEHRPIIKCKPTSSLLARSGSPQITVLPLCPPTNGGAFNISNSNDSGGTMTFIQPINPPQVEANTDFENSMNSSIIFNPDASDNFVGNITPDMHLQSDQRNMPILLKTLGDKSDQSNMPILLNNTLRDKSNSSYDQSSSPNSTPLLNDFYLQKNLSNSLEPSQADVPVPVVNHISANVKNHKSHYVDDPSPKRLPLKDLQCKLKKNSVDLKCGFCYKYLKVHRCLVKFKIVISEMCKKSILNQTFHVKFNILPCNGFSISVMDSSENSQDICRWLSKYQSQLIRAFKKDEILKTIKDTVVGSNESVRNNVKVFLNIISEFKIDC